MCFQRGRCCETGIEALKATSRNERRDEVNPFLDIGEGEDSYCTNSDETDAGVNDGQSEKDLESDVDVDGSRSGSGAVVVGGQYESDVDVDDTRSESDVEADGSRSGSGAEGDTV